MASRHYISIIRLFKHCDIAAGENFNFSRAKKQLHAEFRFAQNGIIDVDGYAYTYQDVFEEIERVNFSQRLIFHEQIWESPQLLLLLEKNTADLSTLGDEFKPFWNNKEFDIFFSPYFAGPFNYLARTLLTERKLKETGDLLAYEDFLQPAEREEAFRPLRIFLDESIRILRNVNGENYKLIRPKIAHWVEDDWFVFFNHLPHEFYDIKIEITTKLLNIGVSIQKSHRGDCRKISAQLVSLMDIPQIIRSTILANHEVYSRPRAIPGFRNGWWLIWVVFIFFRLIGSDSCSDNSNYNFSPMDVRYNLSDSVIKRIRDSFLTHSDTLKMFTAPPVKLKHIGEPEEK